MASERYELDCIKFLDKRRKDAQKSRALEQFKHPIQPTPEPPRPTRMPLPVGYTITEAKAA